MARKYEWYEISGSSLPVYTHIPNDMRVVSDNDNFDLSKETVAWYLEVNSGKESYMELVKK
ncbi:hypothetical protein [Bacillus pseudomycoides]|uniref:hypothetical protein n=1 Tax=Bacillus pseudomycoides TaxID=64104 RepID=UPI000BF072F9|nr:hypothetical protein [Bacillus pseudomycoides]PEM69299.1 hypothetical protein CN619_21425 [Bacillus pseudomycoides]